MEEEEINRLERLAEEQFKCPYLERCCTPKYDQCYNHSHILCSTFERFYNAEKDRQRR